jgi:hypothetical protein
MRLVLTLPPTKNRLYRNARRWTRGSDGTPKSYTGRQHSRRYVAYLEEAGWEVIRQTTLEDREALARLAVEHPLSITARVRFPENGRRHDAANVVDSLLDAVKGPLGIDDERFWHIEVRRVRCGPECEVVIEPLEEGNQ